MFRFTLSHNVLGSQQIDEPDGWNGSKIVLERHNQFYSLIENYYGSADSGFIFYGDNGVENGGIDFIKQIEQTYGFDENVSFVAEYAPDGYTYEDLFSGLADIALKDEFTENKMMVPVIRDDFWSRFISKMETPVNLSSTTDINGNAVDPVTPVIVNLTPQKVRQQFVAHLDKTASYPGLEGVLIDGVETYVQFDWNIETLSEIDERFSLPIIDNPERPGNLFQFQYAGEYQIEVTIDIADVSLQGTGPQVYPGTYLTIYMQVNDDTPIAFSETNLVTALAPLRTRFTLSETVSLGEAGGQIRFYGERTSTDHFYVSYQRFDNLESIDIFNKIEITADTIHPQTEAQGYLLHDAFAGVLARYGLGQDSFYSEMMGSALTNARQYGTEGCAWNFVVLKGLQLRDYSLTEKPFFTSFKELWDGANPIFNFSLCYDEIGGDQVVRIEEKSEHFDETTSIDFSNVYHITSNYDKEHIFNKINVGYKNWESEDIASLDDPQTRRVLATQFSKSGKPLELESEFICAGLAAENTRRTEKRKTKDHKYDNKNFLIHVREDDVSPQRYTPELDENFNSVSGLLNSDSRYNLILTPIRNFLRWANFVGGCLQMKTTSSYVFVSGEGNYDMVSDYNCTSGKECLAKICDPVSEKGNISLATYNAGLGYLFFPMIYNISIPMEWEEFKIVRANPKKAIGISQTDTGHAAFFIKKLEYDIVKGSATIEAWPKEYFDIQVVFDDDNAPPDPIVFDADYQAILDYADGQGYSLPSDDQQVKQNDFVLELKSLGVWSALDILYVFATDGDRNFAKINWKNPGVFTCTEVNTPTFTTNEGFLGNGSSSYLNTGWDPSNNGVNFLRNNSCWFIHCNNEPASSSTNWTFGSGDLSGAGGNTLLPKQTPFVNTVHSYGNNCVYTSNAGPVTAQGFYHGRRTGANARQLYKNGSSVHTAADASDALTSRDLFICAYNDNGGTPIYSTSEISIFGAGASLSGLESGLYNAWNDYFTSL